MKTLSALLLACALAAPAADPGWVSLFDGRTSKGWKEVTGKAFPADSWRIEDGCLKAFPNPDGNQDIRTAEVYERFELQFEWRIARGGNSGVKYLVQRMDEWRRPNTKGMQARARGPEYQLVDDTSGEGLDPRRATAALYSVIPPRPGAGRPAGAWNRSRLVVRGDHVEHWLNDVKVLEYSLHQPDVEKMLRQQRRSADAILRISPICLQNHGSPVWFRQLRIRRLQGSPDSAR